MIHHDLIIVGLGAMGSAAAYHAARAGLRVLGLEQFDIPHAKGSSHGFSRMIRHVYHEHPDYVPLLRRAYELWFDLERTSGQKLLHMTGGIYMGPPDGEVVPGALLAARKHGLEHELLDRAQIASRFPEFVIPDHFQAVVEPMAGFLLPERCISLHAHGALLAGAELHGHEPVLDWEETTRGIRVRTPRGEYSADQFLFCGGAWSGKLLRDLGVDLLVTRQPLGWVWPSRPERFSLGNFAVWGIETPDHKLAYGFPMMPDNPGLKVALHGRGVPADPDTISRDPAPGDELEIRAVLRHLRDTDGPLLALRICMYTNSPDSHFIIDRHPRHPRVLLAAGFSGHGFKFASVVGEALAQLAANRTTELPISFLSLRRFGQQ